MQDLNFTVRVRLHVFYPLNQCKSVHVPAILKFKLCTYKLPVRFWVQGKGDYYSGRGSYWAHIQGSIILACALRMTSSFGYPSNSTAEMVIRKMKFRRAIQWIWESEGWRHWYYKSGHSREYSVHNQAHLEAGIPINACLLHNTAMSI